MDEGFFIGVNMKLIPLTQGKFAMVDDADHEWLNDFKWFYHKLGWSGRQSKRINGKQSIIYMHRAILGAPKGVEIDHINHNKIDNRRKNLRLCTRSQNMMNMRKGKMSKDGYKGVYIYRPNGKWVARITINGKYTHIGYFYTAKEAAIAYNDKAVGAFGEYACLNKT